MLTFGMSHPHSYNYQDERKHTSHLRVSGQVDTIFGHMIRNTIEFHIELPDYSGPIFWRNQFHTEGLNAQNASAHLINSPWVTLNQQYCAEYLQAFVREVELRERFVCLYPARPGITRVTDIKDSLQLITSRYDIAGLYTDIDTLSRMLLSRIKGILPLAQTHHDYTVSATDHDNNKYEAENVDAVVSEHATNAPAITNHHHEPCHTSSDDDKNDDQSVETPPLPRHRHECVCVTIDEDDLATSSSSGSI